MTLLEALKAGFTHYCSFCFTYVKIVPHNQKCTVNNCPGKEYISCRDEMNRHAASRKILEEYDKRKRIIERKFTEEQEENMKETGGY